MTTITKTNTNKNVVEFRRELDSNGIAMENIYINNRKFCCIGYVSERDKQACLKAIQTAIDGSENEYEAMMKLMTIANLGDKEVIPDKEITINNAVVLLSYEARAAYDCEGNEIANCRELTCELPCEAIDAILIPRIKDTLENA